MAKPAVHISGTFRLGDDLPIYRLGFGAMRITGAGIWGDPKNPKEARDVLRGVVKSGINLIDTADSYGPEVSENLIAETLHPYPSNLIIATKGGYTRQGPDRWSELGRPKYLIQCVEMSLRRLRVDRIDLYQLHCIDPLVPIEDSLGALKEMQKQGKIRHIGLSNVTIADIQRATKIVKIVSIQNLYNIENRKSEEVLNYCEKNHLGFIPWYPLSSGNLTSSGGKLAKLAKAKGVTSTQIALAWLLKHSPVILPIPGTSSLAHLKENIAAAAIELTNEEMALLNSLK
jgi:pyridoxine 4-dehydrogenase